jgi:hypothetical protein
MSGDGVKVRSAECWAVSSVKKSSTHTARTPLLSKWVPGCCEHGGTPNQTGSGDAYRISSSCTITKLPCQPPLALHTFRSNLVSTGFTRTTVQRSPRVRAVCVDEFSEWTCARAVQWFMCTLKRA